MTNNSWTPGSRAEELTALLHGAPEPNDHAAVRSYVNSLCDIGVSVLLCYPGTKKPFDGRTVRQRNADDQAARAEAKSAGRTTWAKAKSPAGLTLATDDTDVLDKYLDEYIKRFGHEIAINVAIELGKSGLVAVDADTAVQVDQFLNDADESQDEPPSVSTPGSRNEQGNWVHSDGGHWYFVVPKGLSLPEQPGALTVGKDGYTVLWSRHYVIIPPSVRPEGSYKATGEVHVLPEWLSDEIVDHSQTRAERVQRSRGLAGDTNDPIVRWGAGISWEDILHDADGWSATGRPDNCGCEIWTAPGAHASEKSATAHEPGCASGAFADSADPPLHLWTDHSVAPFDEFLASGGGSSNVTRLQAVAAIYYENNLAEAMDDLNLHEQPTTLGSSNGRDVDDETGAESTSSSVNGRGLRVTWASEIVPKPVPWLWVDITERNTWKPGASPGAAPDPFSIDDVACVANGRDWTPPEVETDGRIACGMVSIAAGREGTGKSTFGIWLTARITRGQLPGAFYGNPKRVFYLATEDSWEHTLVPRLNAAGADMAMVGRVEVIVQHDAAVTLCLPDDVDLLASEIVSNEVALVVVDPLMSTLGAGLDANGSRDVRSALEPLAAMADRTGVAVVGIAHFNKATGMDALSRITGSGAFKDVARAVLVFARDDEGCIFTQVKNSVGRTDLPSLRYEIEQAVIETPTGKAATSTFRFSRIAERTVDDTLVDERRRSKKTRSPVTQFVIDYIKEHKDDNGEVDAADVIAAGEIKGFSKRQITDARMRSRSPEIDTRKEGFGGKARNVWWIDE